MKGGEVQGVILILKQYEHSTYKWEVSRLNRINNVLKMILVLLLVSFISPTNVYASGSPEYFNKFRNALHRASERNKAADRLENSMKENIQSRLGFLSSCPPTMVLGLTINCCDLNYRWNTTNEFRREYVNVTYPVTDRIEGHAELTITGVVVEITNSSDQVRIVRWRESSISTNSFSGIPFLDGMYYYDAGTANTPDTIIGPGQKLRKEVSMSRIGSNLLGGQVIVGESVPINGSVNVTLLLKIVDETGNGTYCTVTVPPIGLK